MQDNVTLVRGNHLLKAGFDVRREYVKSFFFPTIRGLLRYSTLNNFVNDIAEATNINKPLPGGADVVYYRWWDQYYFAQDDWRIGSNLTLNLGLRYELPGNNIQSLIDLNESILQANNGNAVFTLDASAQDRSEQLPAAPRLQLAANDEHARACSESLRAATGLSCGAGMRERTITRSSTSRSTSPVRSRLWPRLRGTMSPARSPCCRTLQPASRRGSTRTTLNRTVVADDFRAPTYDQLSFGVERQLTENLALRAGYVGTFGNDLFQTLDGNPRQPFAGPTGPRVDPTRGVIRLRANAAESWYHSIQTGLEKRFSGGLSAGVHYTWSRFTDTASEVFNPSVGEVAVAQDSFNIVADKGRATYDRPQRLTGNFVWELPWMRGSRAALISKILGGWQLSSFFTFQSGAPFTPLNGSDPTGALAGIDGLVGNAIRPNPEHGS